MSLPRAPLWLLLPLLASGCRSAEAHRADADDEVYSILADARSRVSLGMGVEGELPEVGPEELPAAAEVVLERPSGSLRERILAGEVGTDPEEPVRLGLREATTIAAEDAREYQSRRERLYLVALALTRERWEFSVQESGTLGALLTGSGQDSVATAGGGFSLMRLFTTGAKVMGSVGLDLTRDLTQGNGFDALSNLSLNIVQPLLRGFGQDIVREPLTQAERDVIYEARNFERFRRTFAVDVAQQFYRLLEEVDTLKNEETNYERLTELRIRNEAFARAGRLSDIEVDQARQDELRARNRVVDARRQLENAEDDFKFFLGLPTEAHVAPRSEELEGLAAGAEQDLQLTEAQSLKIALAERLDYLTDRERVEDAERGAHVAADALRAGLDLSTDIRVSDTPIDELDWSDADWTVRLDLDLPIDRLPERNAYRAALIALDAARRSEEESRDSVVSQVRAARRELEAARLSYEIQTGAVTLAERRVESAQLNLEAGRASTRDVLEAQEDLLNARNAATQSLIDLTLSRLAYHRDMELLRLTADGLAIDTEPAQRILGGEAP